MSAKLIACPDESWLPQVNHEDFTPSPEDIASENVRSFWADLL